MLKLVKSAAGGFLNIISHKNSKEAKDNAAKNTALLISTLGIAQIVKDTEYDSLTSNLDRFGQFVNDIPHLEPIKNWFSANGYSPLEAVKNALESGFVPVDTVSGVLYLAATYAAVRAFNSNKESPIQDELAKFGGEVCPYQSFTISQNDLKAKNIQMSLNKIHNIANEFDHTSLIYKSVNGFATVAEKIIDYVSPKFRKFLSLIKKEEFGFELLKYRNENYNNPILVNELPIARELKDIIRPETFDIHNNRNTHERAFVSEVRKRAAYKAQYEIRERNISLAIARLIYNYKQNGEFTKKEKQYIENLKTLSDTTSTDRRPVYVEISKVAKHIFDNIDNYDVKNLNLERPIHENLFHILTDLDRVCGQELNCKNLRKPMMYREIYRNELIFAIQERLRGKAADVALINRMIQNEAPLVKRHFFKCEKLQCLDLMKKDFRSLRGKIIINPETFDFKLTDEERKELADEHKGLNYDKFKNLKISDKSFEVDLPQWKKLITEICNHESTARPYIYTENPEEYFLNQLKTRYDEKSKKNSFAILKKVEKINKSDKIGEPKETHEKSILRTKISASVKKGLKR